MDLVVVLVAVVAVVAMVIFKLVSQSIFETGLLRQNSFTRSTINNCRVPVVETPCS